MRFFLKIIIISSSLITLSYADGIDACLDLVKNDKVYVSPPCANERQPYICSYKKGSFINCYLRFKSIAGVTNSALEQYKTALVSELRNLPNFEGTVGRLLPNPHSNYNKKFNQVGKIFVDKGFLSTSTRPDFINAAGLIIHSKTGKDISNASSQVGDSYMREVLFAPGTKFKVTKVDTNISGNLIITMDEIVQKDGESSSF